MPNAKFYYFKPACSLASHIALEEAGMEFEAISAHPAKADERSAYLEVNPTGAVPALLLGEKLLTENLAIMAFAESQAEAGALMPTDPLERAHCLSFLAWCSNTVHITFRQWARPDRTSPDASQHETLKQAGLEAFGDHLNALNGRLAEQSHLMGENFTVADGYGLVFYQWGLLAQLPIGELEHFTRFKDAMIERPAVRRVLEREQSDLLR